jgi:hypothetical protein
VRDFLRALFENVPGAIELRCIEPEGNREQNRRSYHTDGEVVERTAEQHNGHLNVYFGVATRDGKGGKKENLVAVNAVWIDVDYEDPEEDRLILAEQMRAFDLEPSIVVLTGGGAHVYWLLAEPLVFDQTPQGHRRDLVIIENILAGLAENFGSDHSTTDASRILRLPGTINLPDPKKRAKGRVRADCTLKLLEPERRYGLEKFQALHDLGVKYREAQAKKAGGKRKAEPREEAAQLVVPERVRAVLETDRQALKRFKGNDTGLSEPGRDSPSDSSIDLSLANLLAKHRTLTREDLEAALRASRSYRGAKEKHPSYYGLTIDKAWHESRRGASASVRAEDDWALWMRMHIRSALDGYQTIEPMPLLLHESGEITDTDRWTSTVVEVDDGMGGGFYGLSVVSGKAGGGKSILTLASAIEAAEAGWHVVFFNTELDKRQFANRVWRHGISKAASTRFHPYDVGPMTPLEDLAEWLCAHVTKDTERILGVIDSSTTFARLAGLHKENGTLSELSRMVMWCSMLRRKTEGRISFLLVSELNSGGEEYGREIQHLADLVLRVTKTEEQDVVELECIKGREGGESNYGLFTRDWRRGRLERRILADIRASEDEEGEHREW